MSSQGHRIGVLVLLSTGLFGGGTAVAEPLLGLPNSISALGAPWLVCAFAGRDPRGSARRRSRAPLRDMERCGRPSRTGVEVVAAAALVVALSWQRSPIWRTLAAAIVPAIVFALAEAELRGPPRPERAHRPSRTADDDLEALGVDDDRVRLRDRVTA